MTDDLVHDQLAAPITGVRFCRVRVDSNQRMWFAGLAQGSWYGPLAFATCSRREYHDAPDPWCTCGFWVLPDAETLTAACQWLGVGNLVEVTCWGRVIEHESGWRAEHMAVRRVHLEGDGTCGCGRPATRFIAATSTEQLCAAQCETCAPDAPSLTELAARNGVEFAHTSHAAYRSPHSHTSSPRTRVAFTSSLLVLTFALLAWVGATPQVDGYTVTRDMTALPLLFAAVTPGVLLMAWLRLGGVRRTESGPSPYRWLMAPLLFAAVCTAAVFVAAPAMSTTPTAAHAAKLFADAHDLVVIPARTPEATATLVSPTGQQCDVTFEPTARGSQEATSLDGCLEGLVEATD